MFPVKCTNTVCHSNGWTYLRLLTTRSNVLGLKGSNSSSKCRLIVGTSGDFAACSCNWIAHPKVIRKSTLHFKASGSFYLSTWNVPEHLLLCPTDTVFRPYLATRVLQCVLVRSLNPTQRETACNKSTSQLWTKTYAPKTILSAKLIVL